MQSTMLRRSQAALLLHGRSCAQAARAFATTSQTGQESEPQATYHVPAGHANSDLSDVACNLSLSRRRDLTLRQDLRVVEDGKSATIADILKGKLVALFGVPDMGKVCQQNAFPDYLNNAAELRKKGIDKIICATVAPYAEMKQWASKLGDDKHEITLVADETGGMTRMLGLDLEPGKDGSGPRSQRYSALIDGGILLKLKVERSLKDVKVSNAEHLMQSMHTLKCGNLDPSDRPGAGETVKAATAL
mmetsp:Transcript_6510/g.18725  ORF Transcript_6510/g.18725 Transcript_6510/m.18725 type:complete len:247 (+) Transcript_6510:147-887(+)